MKSIRTKIIFFIGGSVLIGMLISIITSMIFLNCVLGKENTEVAMANSKLASDIIDEYIMNYRATTDTLAANEAIREMLAADTDRNNYTANSNYKLIYNTLNTVMQSDSNILSAFVAKTGTDLSFDGGDWLCDPEFDVTTRSYWFANSDDLARGYMVTEPYQDVDTGKIVITVSSPVYAPGGNSVVGVAAIDITIDEAGKTVLAIETPYNADKSGITLVSADDVIVATEDANLVLKKFEESGIDSKFVLKDTDAESYSGKVKKDGKTYYVNTVKSSFTGWKVLFEIESSEFLKGTHAVLRDVLIINILILIALTAIFLAFASCIVKPLTQLNGMAKAIAAGDLDTVIKIPGRDESAQLADSLYDLVQRLKKNLDYIDEIYRNLQRFANGYLKIELKEAYDGEFAKLKTELQQVSDIFTETIGDIMKTSGMLATASEGISSTSQVIAEGAAKQSSTTEELVATINELSNNVEQNANNAVASSKQVKLVGDVAAQSNVQMKEMIAAIDEINDKSSEIGKIIKVIEDIAFQTNILALNAAVEAARAGEAGKGFAVVADEVRNLASKSAEAAKDTTILIEETVRAVENGTAIANVTGEKLEEVVDGVKGTVELINQISEATVEEAATLKTILSGVEHISEVVQNNAANIEETTAASEELASQAITLDKVVKKFKND